MCTWRRWGRRRWYDRRCSCFYYLCTRTSTRYDCSAASGVSVVLFHCDLVSPYFITSGRSERLMSYRYYYSYYYSFDFQIEESTIFTTTIYETTTLSISTKDSAAASSWLQSVTVAPNFFPTPADATTLPPLPSPTSTPVPSPTPTLNLPTSKTATSKPVQTQTPTPNLPTFNTPTFVTPTTIGFPTLDTPTPSATSSTSTTSSAIVVVSGQSEARGVVDYNFWGLAIMVWGGLLLLVPGY